MALKAHLFIVDPQNDFMGNNDGTPYSEALMDGTAYSAALSVKGSTADMDRLAALIRRVGHKFEDIHVTLDSHRPIDVAHPSMWRDAQGRKPAPYTLITHKDILDGTWTPRNPSFRKRMLDYTAALESGGKYVLIIWPEHCLIGTWGHNIYAPLMRELLNWEREQIANVDYIVKGTNAFTEHYGGLMAEVPDPSDESTQLNTSIISALQSADIVAIAGEASSHCVKATVEQIVENIGDAHLGKLHILTDCTSPVPQQPGTPDFPAIAAQFLADMQSRGLRLTSSTDFLA